MVASMSSLGLSLGTIIPQLAVVRRAMLYETKNVSDQWYFRSQTYRFSGVVSNAEKVFGHIGEQYHSDKPVDKYFNHDVGELRSKSKA